MMRNTTLGNLLVLVNIVEEYQLSLALSKHDRKQTFVTTNFPPNSSTRIFQLP